MTTISSSATVHTSDPTAATVEGATDPSARTPSDVAKAQRRLSSLQWAIPALTGTLLVMDALLGEQQRPAEVGAGLVQRLLPAA